MEIRKTCKLCKKPLTGRKGQKFCCPSCKANYHYQLKKVTQMATYYVDNILHRNRSILLETLGKNAKQKTVSYEDLAKRNFKFDYCTGIYENNQGKLYRIVYDFSWIKFSDGQVTIFRRK